MIPSADIIVPIHNHLDATRDCLESVARATESPYRLWLIDDGSDKRTHEYLEAFCARHEAASLSTHPEALGFVQSCNEGMALGDAPFVVLLNSDVIVPPGWLSRLIRAARSDPAIAVVNPLSNFAANLSLPLAPGCHFLRMDEIVRERSRQLYPDVVTCVGFCFFLVREHLRTLGFFDPAFGPGYCEDSDFCMRALSKGLRTVVADDVYLYHQGRVSFDNFSNRYAENQRLFDARWSSEYSARLEEFERKKPLQYLRDIFAVRKRRVLSVETRRYFLTSLRSLRAGRPVHALKSLKGGLVSCRSDYVPALRPEYFELIIRPDRLKVTYVLPQLNTSGGVLSVVQLVNRMILAGIDTGIACIEPPAQAIQNWRLLTEPLRYKNRKDLLAHFPPSDLAVATMWTTAEWVAELRRLRPQLKTAYFIQDYEPWFYPDEIETQRRIVRTYSLIPHRIVKSSWLQDKLARDGFAAEKIRLGMNLDIFYPRESREKGRDDRVRVLAMARPEAPHRGFRALVEFMHRFFREEPRALFVLFGCAQLPKEPLEGLPIENAGIVPHGDRLADLYRSAEVFLDPSDFQGFGRGGLEAMACGTPTVLTREGGVNEYARDDENCLLVEPGKVDAWIEAVQRILREPLLRNTLIEKGIATTAQFDLKREAEKTMAFFESLCGVRSGRTG